MNWLELLILYTTTKRGDNEWYSKADLISAANQYSFNNQGHSGPYSNASGYGPSDGRFTSQNDIENKRKTAVCMPKELAKDNINASPLNFEAAYGLSGDSHAFSTLFSLVLAP
jgi:hypothetical protein